MSVEPGPAATDNAGQTGSAGDTADPSESGAADAAGDARPAHRRADRPTLRITIDDDGPGISADQRASALARGGRLDERRPSSGLGLAIVQELAALYSGSPTLDTATLGGARAVLTLPAAEKTTRAGRDG